MFFPFNIFTGRVFPLALALAVNNDDTRGGVLWRPELASEQTNAGDITSLSTLESKNSSTVEVSGACSGAQHELHVVLDEAILLLPLDLTWRDRK